MVRLARNENFFIQREFFELLADIIENFLDMIVVVMFDYVWRIAYWKLHIGID